MYADGDGAYIPTYGGFTYLPNSVHAKLSRMAFLISNLLKKGNPLKKKPWLAAPFLITDQSPPSDTSLDPLHWMPHRVLFLHSHGGTR
jgi:hypothetical protein